MSKQRRVRTGKKYRRNIVEKIRVLWDFQDNIVRTREAIWGDKFLLDKLNKIQEYNGCVILPYHLWLHLQLKLLQLPKQRAKLSNSSFFYFLDVFLSKKIVFSSFCKARKFWILQKQWWTCIPFRPLLYDFFL